MWKKAVYFVPWYEMLQESNEAEGKNMILGATEWNTLKARRPGFETRLWYLLSHFELVNESVWNQFIYKIEMITFVSQSCQEG